jgi:hypothetical protein
MTGVWGGVHATRRSLRTGTRLNPGGRFQAAHRPLSSDPPAIVKTDEHFSSNCAVGWGRNLAPPSFAEHESRTVSKRRKSETGWLTSDSEFGFAVLILPGRWQGSERS